MSLKTLHFKPLIKGKEEIFEKLKSISDIPQFIFVLNTPIGRVLRIRQITDAGYRLVNLSGEIIETSPVGRIMDFVDYFSMKFIHKIIVERSDGSEMNAFLVSYSSRSNIGLKDGYYLNSERHE